MVLEALKARRSTTDNQVRTLLSLARPDFSNTTRNRSLVARHYLEILGVEALSDLRESEAESNGVCEAFGRDRSRQLLRNTATEAALRKELEGAQHFCTSPPMALRQTRQARRGRRSSAQKRQGSIA